MSSSSTPKDDPIRKQQEKLLGESPVWDDNKHLFNMKDLDPLNCRKCGASGKVKEVLTRHPSSGGCMGSPITWKYNDCPDCSGKGQHIGNDDVMEWLVIYHMIDQMDTALYNDLMKTPSVKFAETHEPKTKS